MRNRVAWALGGLGVAGAVALRVRRGRAPAHESPVEDERAVELRRRLEESRALVEERDEFEEGETTVDEAAPAPSLSPAERRRQVHDHARAALEEMRRSAPEE